MTETQTRDIPFGRPWVEDEDKAAVMEVLNGHILTHGPKCKEFETSFSKFMGDEAFSVSMSSCMAALHMCYFQMGIGKGDEVIVPAQTHNATAHAVEITGAKPVFCDCQPETGNLNTDKIEALITPATKAIALVHFLGIPCDMDKIMAIAKKHNLKVIEDCALAVGARFDGKHVGLIGTAGCYSFYPVKHITTGEGGLWVSNDEALSKEIAMKRAFGVDRTHTERKIPGLYDVVELGLNYRMSELQAALGCVQVKKLPAILKARKSNFNRLKSVFENQKDLAVLDSMRPEAENSHYCLVLVLDGKYKNIRNELVLRLKDLKVGCSIYYPHPVPRMTYYKNKYGYEAGSFPEAERISDQGIALPVGPHLNEDDMDYVGTTVLKVLKELI